MQQQFISILGSCGNILLACLGYATTIIISMRQQFISVLGAFSNNLHTWLMGPQFISVLCSCYYIFNIFGSCGNNLLAYSAHAATIYWHMQCMQQQFISILGSCGYNLKRTLLMLLHLLAYSAV
jgi:hypothetical protein